MLKRQAAYLSFVWSTGAAALSVRSRDGVGDYMSIAMRGCCSWNGGWAHDLQEVPAMALENLRGLQARGWQFDEPGFLSQAWRQHDMCVVGSDQQPLIPALGWRCNLAVTQTAFLNQLSGYSAAVGRVEERFLAAKLLWALEVDPTLRFWRVMFSGDWFAGMLCDRWCMSDSDALSNGILRQDFKALADDELRGAGINPDWFTPVVPSNAIIGVVRESTLPSWRELTHVLKNWKVVAFLGDNQASAAGCATYRSDERGDEIVISMGNSSTVNRVCRPGVVRQGNAACFDYWSDRLLLLMSEGATWYDAFVGETWRGRYDELNQSALQADLPRLVRVHPPDSRREHEDDLAFRELAWTEQLASVQFSIALDALLNVKTMLHEIPDAKVASFVLTGGLLRCPLLRFTLREGLSILAPTCTVLVIDRSGPLAYKTDALGAIFNAMMAERGQSDLRSVVEECCRRKSCDVSEPLVAAALRKLLMPHLFAPDVNVT